MHFLKILWGIRGLIYKPFFRHFGMPSYIGRPCFLSGCRNISIGKKTRIFPQIRLEAIGKGSISIGNNCAIEQNVHITSKDSDLVIGDNVTISAYTFISNIDHEYRDISRSVMEQKLLTKETLIEDGCFIGFGVSIQAGTHLGKHCVVGTGAVVRGIYPDYSVIVGVPGKVIKRFNIEKRKWEKI